MQPSAHKPLTIASTVASTSLAIAAAAFGANREFGMFFVGLVVLPALFILSLILLGMAHASDKSGRSVKASALLLVVAPLTYFAAVHFRDRVLFTGWSITHHAVLQAASSKDVIIAGWDSWGWAGFDNESYLVSDRFDDSSDIASAERWRVRMGLDCPIVATERMQKGIYIVTIYDCSFDKAKVPNG